MCILDDIGLLCKVGGVFSLTPAGPVVPCHERVFQKNTVIQAEASQATTPPAVDPAEAPIGAPLSPSINARLDRIDARIQHIYMLQLLVDHFLPGVHQRH